MENKIKLSTFSTLVIFFSLFNFLECTRTNSFKVKKFLIKDGYYSHSGQNKLLSITYFDSNARLIAKTQLSRSGCNIVDSTKYNLSEKNTVFSIESYEPDNVIEETCVTLSFKLRDKFLLYYNSKGEYSYSINLNKQRINDNIFYSKTLGIKDSLEQLNDYSKSIVLAMNSPTIKHKYVSKNSTSIYNLNEPSYGLFMEYGIPYNQRLKVLKIKIINKVLIEDEFIFDNYKLRRNYLYNREGILTDVLILRGTLDDKSQNKFKESFILAGSANQISFTQNSYI